MNFINFSDIDFDIFKSDAALSILCKLTTFICYEKSFLTFRDEYLKANNYTIENIHNLENDENYKILCYVVLTVETDFNTEFTKCFGMLEELQKTIQKHIKKTMKKQNNITEFNYINEEELKLELLRSLVPIYIKTKYTPLRRNFYDHIKNLFNEFFKKHKNNLYVEILEIYNDIVLQDLEL